MPTTDSSLLCGKNLYEGVHRANDAIANLSEVGGGGVDEETRLRLLSESKFLRAYYYMRLNELYGRMVWEYLFIQNLWLLLKIARRASHPSLRYGI